MNKVVIQSAVLFSLLSLVSCSENQPNNSSPSQVAAKVNGQEITVHHVNEILQQMPATSFDSAQEAANVVLERLINEQLVLEKANDIELDRDPSVLIKLESARQKIIVQEYLKRVISQKNEIPEADIVSYYNDNPQFFENRRTFGYSQVFISEKQNESLDLEAIKTQVDNTTEFQELLDDLNSNGVVYKLGSQRASSEKLPSMLVEPLYSLDKGETGYLTANDGILILHVSDVINTPVSLEEAKPSISQFLNASKVKNEAESLVEALREKAVIEYVGDFSAANQR